MELVPRVRGGRGGLRRSNAHLPRPGCRFAGRPTLTFIEHFVQRDQLLAMKQRARKSIVTRRDDPGSPIDFFEALARETRGSTSPNSRGSYLARSTFHCCAKYTSPLLLFSMCPAP
jgi:hypothetical protein